MLKRSEEKERLWRARIAEQRESGLSIRRYCSREKISEASFHSWKRELALREKERGQANQAVEVSQNSGGESSFVPLRVGPSSSSVANLELLHRSGHMIRIPAGFDDDALRRLLAVLES